eukprot:COSAG01_NODE_14672_length_1423_cov_1.567976_2_plen_42_part_01
MFLAVDQQALYPVRGDVHSLLVGKAYATPYGGTQELERRVYR